jgi:hypothetical protein
MVKTVGILIPTAKPRIKGISANPWFYDLGGKVVGFLWNEKPNGDILLHRIEERLSQRYKLAGTDWGQGGKAYEEASTAPVVNQLAASSDIVVIAIGD